MELLVLVRLSVEKWGLNCEDALLAFHPQTMQVMTSHQSWDKLGI
jgi:hypothetical protein